MSESHTDGNGDENGESKSSAPKPYKPGLHSPLICEPVGAGIRIEDLQFNRYDEAIEYLKRWYVPEEPLCRGTDLKDDPVSLQEFLDQMLRCMTDLTSLVAIQESHNRIVGIIINRVSWLLMHTRTQSRLNIAEGEALQKVKSFLSHVIEKLDIYDHYDVDSYMKIVAISVLPTFRGKGIGMALLQRTVDLAMHLKLRVLTGVFTSSLGQRLALKLGMRMHYHKFYKEWTSEEEFGFSVFRNVGASNYFAALMAMRLPLREPEPSDVPNLEDRLLELLQTPLPKHLYK